MAGGLLAAEPTGVRAADVVWSAAFVAALAYCGGYAHRLTALSVAGAASVVAGSGLSLGFAVAAVVVAAASATQRRPSVRWSTLASALVGLSLLTGSGPDNRTLAALGTAAVSLALVIGGTLGMSRRRRRRVVWVTAGGLGVLVVFSGAGLLAALRARSDIDRGIDAFRAAAEVGTNGDLEGAVEEFSLAERAFREADEPLSSFGRIGRLVPGVSQQLSAASVAVDAAADAAEAAREAGATIDLDAVGLDGGAIDLEALRRTEPPVGALVDVLVRTVERLSAVDRRLLVGPVSDALDDALQEARDAGATADRLHRALQAAPELLGGERPTRYLVLFTSPVEARNRFGFPASFAVLRMEDGRIGFEEAGQISDLDPPVQFDQLAVLVPPRAQPYLGYGVARNWRSVTIPSHGPAVADVAVQLAAQTRLGSIDGVILAAPQALAALVGLTGEIPLPSVDVTLTQDNTVDFLTRTQYLQFPQLGQQADRRDLLGEVAGLLGLRLTQLSLPEARDLIDVFAPLVEQGHLVVSVPERVSPPTADLLRDAGLDGGFPLPRDEDADVVFVGQRNITANKIDLYLRRALDYESVVDEDGGVTAELTLELTNDAPASGLPEYLIGSGAEPPPPPGTNLSTTLIYSRHQLTELTLDGVTVLPPVLFEGGFYVSQVEVALGPGQTRTVHARFSGQVAGSAPQEVVVYPGGLLTPDEATIRVSDARFGRSGEGSTTVRERACVTLRRGDQACR